MEGAAWPAPAPEVALCFLSQLKTTTTAAISKDFTEDRIWLNGREEDVGQPRLQACLRESEWGPVRGACSSGARPVPHSTVPSHSGLGLSTQKVLLPLGSPDFPPQPGPSGGGGAC